MIDATQIAPSPVPTQILQGRPCPSDTRDDIKARLRSSLGCTTSTRGDFDSDGQLEELVLYAELDGTGMPQSWHWALLQSGGGVAAGGPFPMRRTATYPEVVGSADADGRGDEEVFIKLVLHLYHSGGTRELGIFRVNTQDRLVRVRGDDGPFLFPVGGVSRYGEGAECRDVDLDGRPEFVRLRVDRVRYDVQRASERIYEWSRGKLHEAGDKTYRFAKTSLIDPLLRRLYHFTCFDLDPLPPY